MIHERYPKGANQGSHCGLTMRRLMLIILYPVRCHMAILLSFYFNMPQGCGILVPQPGIEPVPLAVKEPES